MSPHHCATIVSLTPLPLEADSRTFRIARALAGAGFRSVVVEGRQSRNRFWDDAIEVRSLAAAAGERAAPRGGALRTGSAGRGGESALYAAFRARDWWHYCWTPRRIVPPADLYYLHSFEFHRVVTTPAAVRGAAIVYDAHDFYRGIIPAEKQSRFDRERVRPFCDALEARLATVADALVTVSDGVAGLMEEAFGRRPVVIRNSHDDGADRAVTADLRARLSLTPNERLCVVVGNRKPGMALDAAVAALELLPQDFHLAFVGRGYDADRERLRERAVATRLHFDQHVLPTEVVPFIRTADIGLLLYEPYSENYRFALPNGFFQIVAAGLPLVRAALPEVEATIANRPIGVRLERLEPSLLAAAIAECAADPHKLRVAAAGLASELSWRREVTRLNDLIDAIMPATAGRRLPQAVS